MLHHGVTSARVKGSRTRGRLSSCHLHEPTDSVAGDNPQLLPVLEKDGVRLLRRVHADAVVRDYCARGGVHLELRCCKFEHRRERRLLGDLDDAVGQLRVRRERDFELDLLHARHCSVCSKGQGAAR